MPQDPWNPGADKGPSTFDITQVFTPSAIQVAAFRPRRLSAARWEESHLGLAGLNITTLTSGSPFTVYSGIQQTGVGSAGGDRPDQIAARIFPPAAQFGRTTSAGAVATPRFFSIPIGVPGGTGPNQGRFGTLGRNTFRGPGFYNLDMALIKDTTFGSRAQFGARTLEFRAEFFNAFNLVNFGLPVNILRGSGFGVINHTAGTSRQIQFSLKLIY